MSAAYTPYFTVVEIRCSGSQGMEVSQNRFLKKEVECSKKCMFEVTLSKVHRRNTRDGTRHRKH